MQQPGSEACNTSRRQPHVRRLCLLRRHMHQLLVQAHNLTLLLVCLVGQQMHIGDVAGDVLRFIEVALARGANGGGA